MEDRLPPRGRIFCNGLSAGASEDGDVDAMRALIWAVLSHDRSSVVATRAMRRPDGGQGATSATVDGTAEASLLGFRRGACLRVVRGLPGGDLLATDTATGGETGRVSPAFVAWPDPRPPPSTTVGFPITRAVILCCGEGWVRGIGDN